MRARNLELGNIDALPRFVHGLDFTKDIIMPDATLATLFHDGLRDILYAERKALQALKKQARAISSPGPAPSF